MNAEQTIPEADLAKAEGIHVFAIGIGVSDGWELRAIASEPADRNAFMLNEFSDLWNISEKLIDATCKGKLPTLHLSQQFCAWLLSKPLIPLCYELTGRYIVTCYLKLFDGVLLHINRFWFLLTKPLPEWWYLHSRSRYLLLRVPVWIPWCQL